MALAEDEEIGRSEKESSLGEHSEKGKMQLHKHAEVKMIFTETWRLFTLHTAVDIDLP